MNTQFHQRQFTGMLFNPLTVPDGADILKVYKDLNKYKEFRSNPGEGIDNNKLLLYIMCVYDMRSPYREKYADVNKRKVQVAIDVGFRVSETGVFDSPIEDFLRGKNEKVNKKIVAFVRMHRSFKYSYLVTMEASYYNMMLEILNGDTKLIREARNVQSELEEMLVEILNLDNSPQIKDELLRYMEDDRIGLRPEDIALKARESKK